MLTIQCLGTGRGATNFKTGKPSTAYVIKHSGKPVLLIDCGAGVGRSASTLLEGSLPADIYLSHNHADHTGDLPLYIATWPSDAEKIKLFGHNEVLKIVRNHRLHELESLGLAADKAVHWNPATNGQTIEVAGLTLQLFKSAHNYLCYGFVMYNNTRPILGWTADSRFEREIYETVATAPVAIVHGRDAPSGDHASFEEIDEFCKQRQDTEFYVSHYESSNFSFAAANVSLLDTGREIVLDNSF